MQIKNILLKLLNNVKTKIILYMIYILIIMRNPWLALEVLAETEETEKEEIAKLKQEIEDLKRNIFLIMIGLGILIILLYVLGIYESNNTLNNTQDIIDTKRSILNIRTEICDIKLKNLALETDIYNIKLENINDKQELKELLINLKKLHLALTFKSREDENQ